MKFYLIYAFTLVMLSTHITWANQTPVVIKRATEPINFDGEINDNIWSEIAPVELTTFSPVYKAEAINPTEIKLCYNDQYLFVSGKMFVSSPDEITSNSKKRDAETTNDWFGLVIDSYNDKTNGLGFFTTPEGLRFDAAVLNDGRSRGGSLNTSWNNFWDVEVTRDDNGWYAEIRIPWTSLQFQPKDGQVTMGITTWRYTAKHNEFVVSPDISPDYGEFGTWRPSLAKEYVFEGIKPKKPFYITPYVLGGFSSFSELNDTETSYIQNNDLIRDVGIDLKYGISNNWTLDLTVNTDFAQVEADNQQVNLTRFNLFFPEKRLFFQERSGLFEFGFPRGNSLFYSRNIGIDEDGAPIPIIAGARVTGRSGKWDVGFLNMQTANTDKFNGENFTVARVTKQLNNPNSYVGLMMTNRTDLNGNFNLALAGDVVLRIAPQVDWSFKLAHTVDSDLDNEIIDFDGQKIFTSLVKRSQRGFVYALSLLRVGKDYNPELGFERRQDYFRHGQRLQYVWYPEGEHTIFSHGPQFRGQFLFDNPTRDIQTIDYVFGYEINFRSTWGLEVGYNPNVDVLTELFELFDDVSVPIGQYTFDRFFIEGNSDITKPLSLFAELEWGGFYDGTRTSFAVEPIYQVSSSLELGASYEFNSLNFEDRNQQQDVHLASLNALVMFSTKVSIASLIQYNNVDQNFTSNIRFRYNPREGVDLFIVYNDLLNQNRIGAEGLNIPLSTERTILLKYSHTFSL